MAPGTVAGGDGTSLHADRYHLMGGDLAQIDALVPVLEAAGLKRSYGERARHTNRERTRVGCPR